MGDPVDLRVHFPEGVSGGARCEVVSPGVYRLLHSELLVDPQLHYGDLVELVPRDDGDFDFVRRTARSPYRRNCFMLSRAQAEAPAFEEFLKAASAGGVVWEVWFKGILLLHRPRGSRFDVREEWRRCFGSAPAEEEETERERSA